MYSGSQTPAQPSPSQQMHVNESFAVFPANSPEVPRNHPDPFVANSPGAPRKSGVPGAVGYKWVRVISGYLLPGGPVWLANGS